MCAICTVHMCIRCTKSVHLCICEGPFSALQTKQDVEEAEILFKADLERELAPKAESRRNGGGLESYRARPGSYQPRCGNCQP